MSIKKLNKELAEEYVRDYVESEREDQTVFNDLFRLFYPGIKARSRKEHERTGIEVEEFESALCEHFARAALNWNPDGQASFCTYWYSTQRNVVQKVTRDEYDKYQRRKGYINIDDENVVEISDQSECVDSSENKMNQPYKLRLIHSLIELSGKHAQKVSLVCDLYLSGRVSSYQEVGDLIGVSKQNVSNWLKKLATYFNHERFGSLDDYVA